MYKRFVKRLLDIIISLCALIILSPLLLILWILVRRCLPRRGRERTEKFLSFTSSVP